MEKETEQDGMETVLDRIVRVMIARLLHAPRDTLDERLLVVTSPNSFLNEAQEQGFMSVGGPATINSSHNDQNIAVN